MTSPIVSICCITYNHAPFIRKALDGFLMQEPPTGVSKDDPWYEILIHDDASTDGTTEIVKEYAEKYPDKIFPLYEEENQYQNVGTVGIDFFNYNRARGRYIAYCEGDDYWTDSRKLQKQVDFMDAHLEYSICFHDYDNYDVRGERMFHSSDKSWYNKQDIKTEQGADLKAVDYFHRVGQPLTMLFRVSMFDFDKHNQYKYYRDTHEIYHLLRNGNGYWMNFNGGVYNWHGGGISTSVGIDQHCWEEREHVMELYLQNRDDKELRAYLIEILLWNHDVFKREGKEKQFFEIVRPFWRCAPAVMMRVSWVALKRDIKEWHKRLSRWWKKKRLQPIHIYCIHHVCAEFDADSMYACDWMPINEFKKKVHTMQQDGVEFISIADAYRHIREDNVRCKRYAVLTFDDGYASLKEILPWLEEQKIPVTLFINGKYLDGKSYRETSKEKYLTKNELFALTSPLIEIANHGWEHKRINKMTMDEFIDSVEKNVELLSTHPNYIPFWAYTYGTYTNKSNAELLAHHLTLVYVNGEANTYYKGYLDRELLNVDKL